MIRPCLIVEGVSYSCRKKLVTFMRKTAHNNSKTVGKLYEL